MKNSDLIRAYFETTLSTVDLRKKLLNRHDAEGLRQLRIVGMDECGRRILADLKLPEGAEERLAQAILSPDLSSSVLRESRGLGRLQRILQPLEFDVVGAGQSESPRKRKKRTAKRKAGARSKKRR